MCLGDSDVVLTDFEVVLNGFGDSDVVLRDFEMILSGFG